MIAFLLAHGVQMALGLSFVLGAGALGFCLSPQPLHRQLTSELTLAATLVCILLMLVPMTRPLASAVSSWPARAQSVEAAPTPVEFASSTAIQATPAEGSGQGQRWWIAALLLAGSGLIASILLCSALLLIRLLLRARPAPDWVARMSASPARVLVSDSTTRPFCCGVLRGVIVLPLALVRPELQPRLRAVLQHEGAHLALGHGRARWLSALAAPLLFWNPLLWLHVLALRRNAELLADAVATQGRDKREYVNELLALAEQSGAGRRLPLTALGVLGTDGKFAGRMEQLLLRDAPLATRSTLRAGVARWTLALLAMGLVNSCVGLRTSTQPITFVELSLAGTGLNTLAGSQFTEGEASPKPGALPPKVRALDGARVRLEGYVIPLSLEENLMGEFMLVQHNAECCIGQLPRPDEWVFAKARPGAPIPYISGQPVVIEGVLIVTHPAEDKSVEPAIFRMQEATLVGRD